MAETQQGDIFEAESELTQLISKKKSAEATLAAAENEYKSAQQELEATLADGDDQSIKRELADLDRRINEAKSNKSSAEVRWCCTASSAPCWTAWLTFWLDNVCVFCLDCDARTCNAQERKMKVRL